ncbi:breast cancer type 2 susceptibility protein-like [Rhopilema esculentum]|uniref:breast cancer type 2 susceptibility protein-like n=1 Tax=Rhopilema esculentum TaxID=499914 RepID=UPI0031E05C0F
MRSNTQKSVANQQDASSPSLFTPSSKNEKNAEEDILRRQDHNFIPTTPASGVAGLDQSKELFSVSSRKRGKDDSFIAALIQSDHSLPRSQNGKYHWLFDTPSDFRESPVRKNKGVSRRSLDKLIDPEPELCWIESMATPPSDTSEREYNELDVSSARTAQSLSPAVDSINHDQKKFGENMQMKRSVARMLFSRAADSKEGDDKNNDQENWNISELQYDDEDSVQLSPSVVQTEAKEMSSQSENKSVSSPVPILPKTDSSGKSNFILKDYKKKVMADEEQNSLTEIDLGDTSAGSLSPPVVPARDEGDSRTKRHVQRTNDRTKSDKMKSKDDYPNASSAKSPYLKSGRSQLHDCPNDRVFQDSDKLVDTDMQMDIECVGVDMSPPAGVAYTRNPAAKVPGEIAKRTVADDIKKEPSQKKIKAICGNKINEQDKTSIARSPQKKSDSSASGLSDLGEVSPDVVSVKRSSHTRYECKVTESTPKPSRNKKEVKSFNRAKPDASVESKILITVPSKNLMTHSVSISPPMTCSEAESLEEKGESIQRGGVNKNSMKKCEISIVNEIISEIVNSAIHEHRPRTQKHYIVRKADDALSPASCVPRTPAKNMSKAARRLKSRIRVSGVKMKKNCFQENISEKPTNQGCLFGEEVSGKQDSEKLKYRKLNRDDQIKDDYRNNNNGVNDVVNFLPSKLDDERKKDFVHLEKESVNPNLECCEKSNCKGEELLCVNEFSEGCEKASYLLKRDICNNKIIDFKKPVENASMKISGEKKVLPVQRTSQEAIIERKARVATACPKKICRTVYENMEEKVVATKTAESPPDNASSCKKTSSSSVEDVLDVLMFGKKCSESNARLHGAKGQQGMDLVEGWVANDADQCSRVVEGCKRDSYLVHQDSVDKEKNKDPEIGFCKKQTSADDLKKQTETPAYNNDNYNQMTMDDQQMKTAKEESPKINRKETEKRTSAKNFQSSGEPVSNVTENDVVKKCPYDKTEIKDFEYPASNIGLCFQNEASSAVQEQEISFCNSDNGAVELRSLVKFDDSTKPSCSDQFYATDRTATDACDKDSEVDINISMTDSLLSDKDGGGLEAYGAEESAPEEKDGSFENDEDGIIRLVNSTFSLDDFTQLRQELAIAPVSSTDKFTSTLGKRVCVSRRALRSTIKNIETKIKCENKQNRVPTVEATSTAFEGNAEATNHPLEDAEMKPETFIKESYKRGEDSTFCRFSTASGRKVNVSVKALEKARKIPESDAKEQDVPDKVSPFKGFSTASGRKVNVSDKALEAARKKLESDAKEQDVPDKVSSFKGFSTASGREVNVSDKALEAARKKLESEAKEKDAPVTVSFDKTALPSFNEESIQADARGTEEGVLQLVNSSFDVDEFTQLRDEDIKKHASSFNGFSKASASKVNVSGKALEAAKKKPESDAKEQDVPDKVSSFKGFSTASGRKVNVSNKAIEAARKKLESEAKEQDVPDKVSSFKGFSTASGKKVNVSDKALEAARKKLETEAKEKDAPDKVSFDKTALPSFNEESIQADARGTEEGVLQLVNSSFDVDEFTQLRDEDINKHASSFNGFITASASKVNVSDNALEAAKKKPESDAKEQDVSDKVSSFKGFSTASGRKVNVSDKALEAARKKLESDAKEQDVSDKVSSFKGFSTASGRKVNVSDKALEAARKKLESDAKEQDVPDKVSSFNGFSTASGRKVNSSDKALEAARKKLESDSREKEVLEKVTSFVGSALGSKVSVLDVALEAAKKKQGAKDFYSTNIDEFPPFDRVRIKYDTKATEDGISQLVNSSFDIDDFTQLRDEYLNRDASSSNGFSSSSGKKVNVSVKALEAARKKLESEAREQDVPDKVSSFNGFSTASGRKVNVSDKALEAARKKLESDAKEQDVPDKVSSFNGFSTASGRKVNVSDKALEAARKKLESEAKEQDVPDKVSSFNGFSTASGRKVNVSDKALEAARKKLESDAKEQDVPDKVSSFNGFSTASGRKVNVSDKALEAARKKLESEAKEQDVRDKVSSFDGFSTASGRKVNVSDKALEAARKKLESDAKEQESQTNIFCQWIEYASEENECIDKLLKQPRKARALEAARKKLESDAEEQDVPDKVSSFNGFSTASGRKVNVSDKALEAAKKKLESDAKEQDVPDKVSSFNGFSTASGRKVNVSDKALEAARKKLESDAKEQDVPDKVSSFNGFSTASGRKVNVSDKALEAARKKLESDAEEQDVPDKVSSFNGFSTASGRKVNVSDKALEAAKKKLESDAKEQDVPDKVSSFNGLSTASGRKVNVSDKALEAARKKLESDAKEQDVPDKVSSFNGFSTAFGRKVNVSDKALEAARKKLESEAKEQDVRDKVSSFDRFSTASGRKVNVSDKALEAARKKLESDAKEQDFPDKVSSFNGFSTATEMKANVSDKAVDAAQKKLESNFKEGKLSGKELGCEGFSNVPQKKDEVSDKTFEGIGNQRKKGIIKIDRVKSRHCKGENLCVNEESTPLILGQNRMGNTSKADVTGMNSDRKRRSGSPRQIGLNCQPQKDSNGPDDFTIELSERFDEDIEMAMEEDPLLLGKETSDMTDHVAECFKQKKFLSISGEKESDLKGQEVPWVSKRRRSLGVNRGSFYFKAKTSSPSEFHSDREAKFTIPLLPKTSRCEDLVSPITSKVGLTRPASAPRLSYGSHSNTTPLSALDQRKMKNGAVKSFSTPFKLSFGNKSNNMATSGVLKNERLKRPLFSCVPFGKRRKIDDEMFSSPGVKETLIRPQAGRLYQMKKSNKTKRLSQATNGQAPSFLSKEQLLKYGIEDCVIQVSSESSSEFVFHQSFFSRQALSDGKAIVGDGAALVISEEGAGPKEFYRAFLSLPGVDSSLINESWFVNQYRWVVWKLACLERSFPEHFACRCLTPNEVMYHLKYRYDKEVDHSERSSLKKIFERDDVANSRLVLCVSRICSSLSPDPKEEGESKEAATRDKNVTENVKRKVELTDGWYPIKAVLDKPLSYLVQAGKIEIGTKLCIYGANLVGAEQAVPPLEAPESAALELCANSTRRAHWDAKLGFQKDRKAFAVPLYSLFPDGGFVGCIDVVLTRVYPMQWMEKTDSGCVFRNSMQEQKASRGYNNEKQKRMEKIYLSIQKEFENSAQQRDKRISRRKSVTSSIKEIADVQNGRELYEMLESVYDPASLELCLSDSQRESLAQYRRQKDEKERDLMQKKFEDAWKDVQENFPERVVIAIQKFKVVDPFCVGKKQLSESYLTVWKPTDDIQSTWKEGIRLKIYNLVVSPSRYKQSASAFQLATMNSTRYDVIATSPESLSKVYTPRVVTPIKSLKSLRQMSANEIDVVGYVVHIEDFGNNCELQTVYIDDFSDIFLGIKVWGGLQAIHLEDVVTRDSVVSFKNLAFSSDFSSNHALSAVFNEMSAAYCNPKDKHLTDAISEIQRNSKDLKSYLTAQRERLKECLRSGSRSVRTSKTTVSQVHHDPRHNFSSPNNNHLPIYTVKPSCSQVASKSLPVNEKTPNTSIEEAECLPNTPVSTCDDETLERSAQKKLNDRKSKALARYGEPKPLSPLPTVMTPRARLDFKPPSRTKKT